MYNKCLQKVTNRLEFSVVQDLLYPHVLMRNSGVGHVETRE